MLLVFWKELPSKEKLAVTELDLDNTKGAGQFYKTNFLVKSNFSRSDLTLVLFLKIQT